MGQTRLGRRTRPLFSCTLTAKEGKSRRHAYLGLGHGKLVTDRTHCGANVVQLRQDGSVECSLLVTLCTSRGQRVSNRELGRSLLAGAGGWRGRQHTHTSCRMSSACMDVCGET